MRHAHPPAVRFGNDGQHGLRRTVPLEAFLDVEEERFVDAIDDLQMPRQQLLEEMHGPGFERLGHQRVVGVPEHIAADIPGLRPRHVVLVD
jgi:hypothetical protein